SSIIALVMAVSLSLIGHSAMATNMQKAISLAASDEGRVVISQVLTGMVSTSDQPNGHTLELIELFNNSDSEVDVTGWCTHIYSANSIERSTCLTTSSLSHRLVLPARANIILVSNSYASAYPGFMYDGLFSSNYLAEA